MSNGRAYDSKHDMFDIKHIKYDSKHLGTLGPSPLMVEVVVHCQETFSHESIAETSLVVLS